MKPLLAACFAALALSARAELRIEISATDPPSPARLSRDEPMQLRIEYEGADQTQLWARPYFEGRPVARAKTNPSRRYTGSGTALGWFSLDGEDAVDEVRILAGGGRPYREIEVLRFPVEARGDGIAGQPRPGADWAQALQRDNAEILRRELAQAASRPPSPADSFIGAGFMLAVVGLFAAGVGGPAWALWKWRGAWRVAGAAPLLAMAFVGGRIVLGTARDPTSHNLWPFEILIASGASAAFLGVLVVARRFLSRG